MKRKTEMNTDDWLGEEPTAEAQRTLGLRREERQKGTQMMRIHLKAKVNSCLIQAVILSPPEAGEGFREQLAAQFHRDSSSRPGRDSE
jgi:hypothetical protein